MYKVELLLDDTLPEAVQAACLLEINTVIEVGDDSGVGIVGRIDSIRIRRKDDRFLNFRYPIAQRVIRTADGRWTEARYSRRIFQTKLAAMGTVSFVEPVSHKQGLSPWTAVVQVDMPRGNRGEQVAHYAINYVPHACDECRVDRPCAHDRFPPHPADEVYLMNCRLHAYSTVMFPRAEGVLRLLFVAQDACGLSTIYHCETPDGRMVEKPRVGPDLWAAMMAQAND